jgi:hypothetical protein
MEIESKSEEAFTIAEGTSDVPQDEVPSKVTKVMEDIVLDGNDEV